jgi:hypothetical protein
MINIKLWGVGILFLILIFVAFWRSDWAVSPAGKNLKESFTLGSNSTSPIGDETPGDKKHPRPTESAPKRIEVMNQLGSIAQASPGLIRRLNLPLFDNNLVPYSSDWELLGTNKETVDVLSNDLKGIFDGIKKSERDSFSVIEQSDSRIQISIPKLKPEEAARKVSQIEDSFSKVFGTELSKLMAQSFIDSHLAILGGVDGRDRVVTITTTTADVLARINRKYEIRTQVLHEGTKLSDAKGNIDNYSQDNGIELVETIPESWSHLFGNSD